MSESDHSAATQPSAGVTRSVFTRSTLAAASLVTAYAFGTSTKALAASAPSGKDVLQLVQRAGVLKVATGLSFAPFGFKDKDGRPVGYEVELGQLMAKYLGIKYEHFDVTADARAVSLESHKADVVISNFTTTPKRAIQVDFTVPYIVAGEVLLTKKGSSIHGIGDLEGKTVAVIRSSTDTEILKRLAPKAISRAYDEDAPAVLAVKEGQVDAMIEDSNFLTYQVKLDPSLAVTHDSLVPLEYNAMGVARGQLEWLHWINTFIYYINHSGENQVLYKKWFGRPLQYPAIKYDY